MKELLNELANCPLCIANTMIVILTILGLWYLTGEISDKQFVLAMLPIVVILELTVIALRIKIHDLKNS